MAGAKTFPWAALLLGGVAMSVALSLQGGEVVLPKVPEGHPRVYVRPGDIAAIRAKLELPEFAAAWKVVREEAAKEVKSRNGPFCRAFVYLVQGERDVGRRAIEETLAMLPKVTDARTVDMPMHWAACVYDWCYALLNKEEKAAFIAEFKRIAASHEPGFPAKPDEHSIVGHGTEGWLLTAQLPAGVAIHDEDQEMYTAGAKLFFTRFVEARNYWYASHMHHQGDHYATRLIYDLCAAWLFRRIGAGDVLSREQQFLPYEPLYNLRPDGQQIKRGDSGNDQRTGRKHSIMMFGGSYYRDPFVLDALEKQYFTHQLPIFHEVFDLLLRPAGIKTRPLADLPQSKYFDEPMGEMVARTGWSMGKESRDALVYMRLGGTYFGNHQKRDMGTFQIYYRGGLAIASGMYNLYGRPHWTCYYHQTLSSNALLIYDPAEPVGRIRKIKDGGQIIPDNEADHPISLDALLTRGYVMGKVTGHAFGPDAMRPEYNYLSGNITKAYGEKVALVTRSMAVLRTDDDARPCVFVVFDRVIAKNKEFKKTWLLHSVQEPELGERRFVVRRDQDGYGGKLDVRLLLPEKAALKKIGGPGKEFWVESTQQNYLEKADGPFVEPGAWRVEISPESQSEKDLFLNVLTPMDADAPHDHEVERLNDGAWSGAWTLGRAVLFHHQPEPQAQAAFKLSRAAKILVCGLAPGWWRVACDGKELHARVPVPASAACLYFEAGAGQVELKRVEETPPPEPADTFWNGLREASKKEAP